MLIRGNLKKEVIIIKPGKTREELEAALIEPTLSVKRTRNGNLRVKENLLNNHKIIGGNVQMWINNPQKELPNLDWRVLYLFAEQIYKEIKTSDINPNHYYTETESKKARQFMGNLMIKEDIKPPLKLESVLPINNDQYMTKINIKTLAQLSSFLLNYNFDIQREAKKIVRGGETIREATLIMENVVEIKDNLKKGTQETTTIVINASAGTADDGNELIYNPIDGSLIINEGTVLDIVDGYHRCRAAELVINENPNIDFEFMVLLLNYTDDMAMNYQGQFAKQTPLSKTRQKQLSKPRESDSVVSELVRQSELRGKVSTSTSPSLKNKEIVSYNVLANTIDEEFKFERAVDAHKISRYLKNYFDILLSSYPEQFIENPLHWKKESVMVENNMFVGYIVLAKRMYENDIPEIDLLNYIEKIDFDRDNPLWKDIGFLNESGSLNETNLSRKNIRDYFNSVKL